VFISGCRGNSQQLRAGKLITCNSSTKCSTDGDLLAISSPKSTLKVNFDKQEWGRNVTSRKKRRKNAGKIHGV